MAKGIKFYISKGLRKYLNPPAIRDCEIHPTVAIWDHCTVDGTKIGKYTYISDHTLISSADIGAFCSISSYCHIGGAAHPLNFVSTSPVFVAGHNAFDVNIAEHKFEAYQRTFIGNDVWIGTHCLIKSGIHIANGAVIGMGSVVVKDVGPYEVWAGNPARFIKKRFDDTTIEKLLGIEWWKFPDKKLKKYGKYLSSPEKLIKAVEEEE